MSSAPSPDEIARDARWLAQALDPRRDVARLVAMDRESYRQASFLDDRLMQQAVDAQLVAWPQVEAAMDGDLRPTRDGSSISVMSVRRSCHACLASFAGVLALREPRLLSDLALTPPEVRKALRLSGPEADVTHLRLRRVACVKATSFVSEIAAELVPPSQRALFMYRQPAQYIASILAGENSVRELHALAPARAERLQHRAPSVLPSNEAELAAAAWACEMTALKRGRCDAGPENRMGRLRRDARGTCEASWLRVAAFFGVSDRDGDESVRHRRRARS